MVGPKAAPEEVKAKYADLRGRGVRGALTFLFEDWAQAKGKWPRTQLTGIPQHIYITKRGTSDSKVCAAFCLRV